MEIESAEVLQNQKSWHVHLATRQDLYRISGFLDDHLPDCCAVHSLVHMALLDGNDSYKKIYFAPSVEKDFNYAAIVGVMRRPAFDPIHGHAKDITTVSSWFIDETYFFTVLKTIDIDWANETVFLWGMNHELGPMMTTFLDNRCPSSNRVVHAADRYYISAQDAFNFRLTIPDGVYVKSLERYQAKTVYDHWAFNHTRTVEDVADEIDQLPSAGVFLKDTDELVCWMMVHSVHGMGRLYTLERYRRRGYATLVTQYLAKRTAQSGFFPYVGILADNEGSKKFFESLGFRYFQPFNCSLVSPP